MENLNEKKQIAEIGIELSNALHEHDIAWTNYIQDSKNHQKPMGEFRAMSEHLYNAGYRKQSEGEWIFEHEFYGKMLCSNCKEEALINEWNEYVDSDFCPNCGAKMKGGE